MLRFRLSYLHQCLGEALQQTPFWSIAQYGQTDLQWVSNSILKEQFDLRRAQKECNPHLIFFKLQEKNIIFFLSDFKNANILILWAILETFCGWSRFKWRFKASASSCWQSYCWWRSLDQPEWSKSMCFRRKWTFFKQEAVGSAGRATVLPSRKVTSFVKWTVPSCIPISASLFTNDWSWPCSASHVLQSRLFPSINHFDYIGFDFSGARFIVIALPKCAPLTTSSKSESFRATGKKDSYNRFCTSSIELLHLISGIS